MKPLLALGLTIALVTTATAQQPKIIYAPGYGPPPASQPHPIFPDGAFDPATEYITAGQDEPGYRSWVMADPTRATYVKSFNDYLVANGVGGVAPTWQLLRTATDWQKCGAQPFDVPPTSLWPNIVAALRYIGAFVEPVVGPVEPVSNYRNPGLNNCAGGARTSTHMVGGAVDMVPLRPVSRERLMENLCRVHVASGSWNTIGLGFYKGLRFHIDARKYREWGTAGAHGGWGCNAVLAEGAQPFTEPVVTATRAGAASGPTFLVPAATEDH